MTTLIQNPSTSPGAPDSSPAQAILEARSGATAFEAQAEDSRLSFARDAAPFRPASVSVASDAGVGRTHNEDSLLSRPDMGLFCVADGMGGFNAGEVASHLAIETIEKRLCAANANLDRRSYESLVLSAINEANGSILRTSARRPECLGMGTTLTLLWLTPVGRLFAHVGDSRLYAFKNGQLSQLSRDHVIEVLPEVLRGKLDNFDGARKGILTRAIGAEQTVEADVEWLESTPHCDYLLCTDGLSDAMSTAEMASQWCSATDKTAQSLVDHALDCGAADNVSAMIVRPN
jgi:PPM family protein phosphatase